MNLNDKQKEALEYTNGPLLILAGAGSGKTRVLTEKVCYLLDKGLAKADEILAITFTNKASKEMKERIQKRIGYEVYNIWISTFHSFGLRILKEHYDKLGYGKNFTIMDSDDSLSVIKKIVKEMDLDPKFYNPRVIKSKISSAKNEMIDEIGYEKYAHMDFEKVVQEIYVKYQKILKSNNCIDFDDLLTLPIKLFEKYQEVLRSYQEKFKYVFIDEYQDTNTVQYILSKMISARYRNICVVGDIDQSIYSFRNADYRNIMNFEKDYKDCKTILLEQNYRSTKNILNAANNVIKNNVLRKEKNLWSLNDEGDPVKYYRASDEKSEADFVIDQIKELNQEGIPYQEMAVLYRTNAQSRTIEESLMKSVIPYKIVGSVYFYNRKEIKDLICYLKLIYNEKDDISLRRIINVPKRKIGAKTIESLEEKALVENKSMFEVISSSKELEFKKIILEFKEASKNLSLTELVELVLEKSGIKDEYDPKLIEDEIRLENLEEFKSITKRFEEEEDGTLESFIENLVLVSDINEHKESSDQVTLMTVHSAKGLEFDVVFIIGLEEGIFPHANSMMSNEELEEERRLCYVAITRARKKLYLVNARNRMLFGKESANPQSRFISEIGEDYLDNLSKPKIEVNIKEKNMKENDISVGDHVFHDKYKKGIVIADERGILTVAFAKPYGIIKVMKNHKSIRKVEINV